MFDLESQALDKFISDLEKTLNDANKNVKETFEEFAERLTELLNSSATADVASSLGKIFNLLMGDNFVADLSGLEEKEYPIGGTTDNQEVSQPVVTPEVKEQYDQIKEEVTDVSHGVETISDQIEDESNEIVEEITDVALGARAISDQLEEYTPLSQSEYLSQLNVDVSSIAPMLKNMYSETAGIYDLIQDDVAKQLTSIEKKINNQATTVNVRYDSLIRVNGAVDSVVVRDLERFADKIVNETRSTIIRDLQSAGFYRR